MGRMSVQSFYLKPFSSAGPVAHLKIAGKIIRRSCTLAISIVIKPQNGEITYWALTHPGPQADFHRRDSFLIEL